MYAESRVTRIPATTSAARDEASARMHGYLVSVDGKPLPQGDIGQLLHSRADVVANGMQPHALRDSIGYIC